MAEVKFGELRSVVEAVRQIVLDWDGFVSNVEALAREHDEYRQTADRLAWEIGELRAAQLLRGVGGKVRRCADERDSTRRDLLARLRGVAAIELHAQVTARGFYERAGYAAVGEEYLEAGIAHVTMRRALPGEV